MGIQHLNDLFKTCRTEGLNKVYDVVIIDGSNIIFQTLCSKFSELRKSGNIITQWQSINMNMVSQISFIINYAIEDIVNTINKYFERGIGQVIMVVDPITSPVYTICNDYKFNHKYSDLIDEDLKNGVNIDLTIKSAEQEKRKAAANKKDIIQSTIDNILDLDELSDEQKHILINIFKQSYIFNENKELLVLGNYVLMSVYFKLRDKNFKMIKAIDEADLVIKNIAESFDNEQILILSADTDYNVLFGNNPNVDTSSLLKRSIVYNPFKCWESLFDGSPSFDFDHIIRLAPLFGNDYTVKEYLVNAVNLEEIIQLYESSIRKLQKGSKRKKITIFANSIPDDLVDVVYDGTELLDLDKLDDFLHDWNPEYFVNYYRSNIIYTNWAKYNKYEEVPKPDEYACQQELDKALTHMLDKLTNESSISLSGGCKTDENNKYVLYKWDVSYMFDDWDKFFSTLEVENFDCLDTFLNYYYENEYRDECDDFL